MHFEEVMAEIQGKQAIYVKMNDINGRLALELEMMPGSKVLATTLDMPVLFEILYQDNIMICDYGASKNTVKSKLGAINERKSTSASLGHAGQAVKATSTVDVPGQFVE